MQTKFGRLVVVSLVLLAAILGSMACSSKTEEPAAKKEVDEPTKAQTLVNLNLRAGPGINYALVGHIPANSEMTVLGRNQDSSWLVGHDDTGNEGWFSADPDFIEIDRTAVDKMAVVKAAEAPAPAYDLSNPKVNDLFNRIPLVVHHQGNFTCASHAGLNNLLPEVTEGNVIGPHAGDFVHVELSNVLFKYSGGSFELIRENSADRFASGAASLPLAEAAQMFERGEIAWTGLIGQWPARGVPGCDGEAKE